jgi:dual specificity phosphatase 12
LTKKDTYNLASVFALSNTAALKAANVTHVLSVLRFDVDERKVDPYKHLIIHVDDVEDENLLEHFPATNEFIQEALDNGGAVLVHW